MNLSTLEAMLSYIYTDSFDSSKTDLTELLLYADLFEMPELVKRCEQKMHESITVENSVEIFLSVFVHRSHAKNVFVSSKRFIGQNFEAVSKTMDWPKLASNPAALLEITQFFCQELKKN
jgi:hypothetical protein